MASPSNSNTRKRLKLPRGLSFDLRSGQWFVSQPQERRPFFEEMLRTGRRDFTVILSEHFDAYVRIAPRDFASSGAGIERITEEEYGLLSNVGMVVDQDDGHIITGIGPALGIMTMAIAPLLGANERGLILLSGIQKDKDGDLVATPGADPAELRSLIFLWDKLNWPETSLIENPAGADAEFLINAGVMHRSRAQAAGNWHSKDDLINLHERTFMAFDDMEPGRWSVGHGSSAEQPSGADPMRKLLVDLTNVVEIPDVNVPLEEVLAFREKRRPELLALRTYIDDLYAVVRANPDDSSAMVAAVDKLAAAVKNQRKTAAETGWVTRATGLQIDLKLDDFYAAASAGYATFMATNDAMKAALLTAGSLGVKLALKKSSEAAPPAEMKYIISVEREFGKRRARTD